MTSRAMLAAVLLALTPVAPSDTSPHKVPRPVAPASMRSSAKAGCSRCNIAALCHTRTNLHSTTTIGPILSRDSAGGRDDVLRQVIADGTPNMPGFKHMLEPTQIAAIAAYLQTVPPQAAKPEKH